MKNFLVFAGAGKAETQYLKWATNKSEVYDRAINFYDRNKIERDLMVSRYKLEHATNNPGMIFNNFAAQYDRYKNYEYVAIIDGDLEVTKQSLEDVFIRCKEGGFSAAQFSRDNEGTGHFNRHYVSLGGDQVTDCNFIEMGFMIIRQDLLKLLVEEWLSYKLQYSTGIDLMLSNIAHRNNMLPFKIFHKHTFYNPSLEDKNGVREIDKAGDNPQIRLSGLAKIKSKHPEKFPLWKEFTHNGKKFNR